MSEVDEIPRVRWNIKSFSFVPGHSGASGRVLQQRCQPIRAQHPCCLCTVTTPQRSRASCLVSPAQVPPQPLSAVPPSHANLPGSTPAARPLPRSLPWVLSTQLQPDKQNASSCWKSLWPPQRGGGQSGSLWSGAESITAVTSADMYVFILWYVKYMFSLSCTMRVFDALRWVHL